MPALNNIWKIGLTVLNLRGARKRDSVGLTVLRSGGIRSHRNAHARPGAPVRPVATGGRADDLMPPPRERGYTETAEPRWRLRCIAAPRNHPNAPVLKLARSGQSQASSSSLPRRSATLLCFRSASSESRLGDSAAPTLRRRARGGLFPAMMRRAGLMRPSVCQTESADCMVRSGPPAPSLARSPRKFQFPFAT
jgi:hypothetical protein